MSFLVIAKALGRTALHQARTPKVLEALAKRHDWLLKTEGDVTKLYPSKKTGTYDGYFYWNSKTDEFGEYDIYTEEEHRKFGRKLERRQEKVDGKNVWKPEEFKLSAVFHAADAGVASKAKDWHWTGEASVNWTQEEAFA